MLLLIPPPINRLVVGPPIRHDQSRDARENGNPDDDQYMIYELDRDVIENSMEQLIVVFKYLKHNPRSVDCKQSKYIYIYFHAFHFM